MKKKAVILLISLCLTQFLPAQDETKNGFVVNLSGGLSGLKNENDAKNTNSFGFQLGADYQYFISPSISISAGLGVSSYKSKQSLSAFEDHYQVGDFEFRTKVSGYEETQTALMLNVPILFHYHIMGFYAGAGVKIGFPLMGKVKSTVSEINNTGYFPALNQELDEPRFMGFGQFTDLSSNEKLKLKAAFSVVFDLGYKWAILPGGFLYTGLYMDLGLNNIQKIDNSYLIQYQTSNPEEFKLGSLSQSVSGSDGENLTKSVKPISFGLKIKVDL